ncbi:hypothetical protein R0J93_24345, partial [Pseudoalteromonas sp. SIMBA_148]
RKLFNQSQNKPAPKVVCAWCDEQPKAMLSEQCSDVNGFQNSHKQFCEKRASYLAQPPIRRKAEILPFSANYTKDKASQFYSALAQTLV